MNKEVQQLHQLLEIYCIKLTGEKIKNMKAYPNQFKFFIFTIVLVIGSISISYGQNPKITHGPYIQHLTNNSVVLNWSSSVNCISWIEYYEEDGSNFYQKKRMRKYNSTGGLKNIGKLHRVIIDGLKSSTKYAYRIYSQELTEDFDLGKVAATRVFQKEPLYFTTLDSEKEETSCIILADMHENSSKVADLLRQVNIDEADFVLLNGDFSNDFTSEHAIYTVIDTCVSIYATEKPTYIVRGNHETRGVQAWHLNQYFYFPDNKYYYTFSIGTTFFIVLDSGEDKPDSDIEYCGFADFDSYRTAEAIWLKEVVESEEYKKAKHRVVFMHIPPYENDRGKEWHGTLDVRKKFVPILNEANIDLMLCGHTHDYSLIKETVDENNFPIIISDNNSLTHLLIDDSGIKVKIIDTDSKLVSELLFKK